MSRIVIVPNEVRDEVNKLLDEAIAKFPDAEQYREMWYQQLIEHFDKHGQFPRIQIFKQERDEN